MSSLFCTARPPWSTWQQLFVERPPTQPSDSRGRPHPARLPTARHTPLHHCSACTSIQHPRPSQSSHARLTNRPPMQAELSPPFHTPPRSPIQITPSASSCSAASGFRCLLLNAPVGAIALLTLWATTVQLLAIGQGSSGAEGYHLNMRPRGFAGKLALVLQCTPARRGIKKKQVGIKKQTRIKKTNRDQKQI